MHLPYSFTTYGTDADVRLGLAILKDPSYSVYLDDEYSYIAIFLDHPEANHVYCAGTVGNGHLIDYFQRCYLDTVIAQAWRHGLPLRVHHHISDEERILHEAHLAHGHGLEAS